MILREGIFRKPRLRTNSILKKFAPLFAGDVINISASNDSDKNCSLYEYYFGNYDSGNRYREYFVNARSYTISNYPGDQTPILIADQSIALDLEGELSPELVGRFDVVFNHTALEHIFDVFKAFENLCAFSRDIVIVIVPQFQKIHDYKRGYKDYWRFTPFAIDRLFENNGLTVLYRETTHGFSESQYLFYIASKQADIWREKFGEVVGLEDYFCPQNDGSKYTTWSRGILFIDAMVRFIVRKTKLFLD